MTTHDPTDHEHDLSEVAPDVQRALAEMVRGVEAGPELRARVARDLRSTRPTRAGVPLRRVLAAAAAVAVLAGGVAVLGGLGDDSDEVTTVADDPEGDSATPDAPPPTVGGVTITRPDDASATTVPTGTETTAPEATAPPTSADGPVTTELVCRNSTDPACGAFRWDPAPEAGQSTVRLFLPAAPAQVGVPYELVVELTDPTAQPTFNCASLDVSPLPGQAWVGGFQCQPDPIPMCSPAKYGPWTPPAPAGGTISDAVEITFDQPGTYTLTMETKAKPRHCDHPYGSDATTSVTVEVLP